MIKRNLFNGLAAIVLLIGAQGCKKLDFDPVLVLKDMPILSTNSPATSTGAALTSKVTVQATDDCTTFSRFDVYNRTPFIHEIRAKASYPAPNQNPACAQVITTSVQDLRFNIQDGGEHTLIFYNGSTVVKTDKIIVN